MLDVVVIFVLIVVVVVLVVVVVVVVVVFVVVVVVVVHEFVLQICCLMSRFPYSSTPHPESPGLPYLHFL